MKNVWGVLQDLMMHGTSIVPIVFTDKLLENHDKHGKCNVKKESFLIFEMVGSKTNVEEKTRAEANGLNQSEGDGDVNKEAFHVGKRVHGSDVLHQSVGTDKVAQSSIHGECPANFSPLRGANESRRAYKSDTIKRSENINGIVCDIEPIVARGNDDVCGEADRTSQQDGMLDRIETEECVDSHKLDKIIGDNEKDAFTKDSAQVQGRSTPSSDNWIM